jgi:hypothetical protein
LKGDENMKKFGRSFVFSVAVLLVGAFIFGCYSDVYSTVQEPEEILTLVSKEVGPNGEDEFHEIYVSSGYGSESANLFFYGDSVVVANITGNFNRYSFGSDDDKDGLGMGWLNLTIQGHFISSDGKLPDYIKKLIEVPDKNISGSDLVRDFEESDPAPGCENGQIYSSVTGEKCIYGFSETKFQIDWNCYTSLYEDDQSESGYAGNTNCNATANGGLFQGLYVNVMEVDQGPVFGKNAYDWELNLSFQVLITGDYEAPVYDTVELFDGYKGKG